MYPVLTRMPVRVTVGDSGLCCCSCVTYLELLLTPFVLILLLQCCFTSTETISTIRDGEPRTATSAFTQLCDDFIITVTLTQCYTLSKITSSQRCRLS